jgi:hypothetical protein
LKVFSPEYEEKIVTEEPRIVLPFYDTDDELVGLTARGIRGEKQRYLVMKIKDDLPMIYNMNNIDITQTIFVTEGPIDSLFLPNAVAVGNSNLKYVLNHLPKDQLVLIYDNEPRNKEIVREIGDAILADANVVIWPKSYQEKDINDMILAKRTRNEILDTINKFTFRGPKALLEYNIWKLR